MTWGSRAGHFVARQRLTRAPLGEQPILQDSGSAGWLAGCLTGWLAGWLSAIAISPGIM